MKKLFTGMFVLMVLLSLTISAEAFDSKSTYRTNGMAAYADWFEETDGVDTYTSIQATTSNDGTDIYVGIYSYDEFGNFLSDKWGYMFTQEDVFTIDKKLNSATLSVNIDLYDWNTDTVDNVPIEAQWTGEGDVMKSSSKYISKYGDFMWKFSDNTLYREATATGSINKEYLGTSDYGQLVKFKSVSMDMNK